MKIRKGDTVKIAIGKDSGRTGKVLRVLPSESVVVVEGCNVYKKHIKGDGQKKESAIVEISKPISVSNVQLVCPACGETSRIGFEIDEKGGKQRVCKKCKKSIDGNKQTGKQKKESTPKKKTGRRTARKSSAKKGKAVKSSKKSKKASNSKKSKK
ncbi:50S ribosomal protein L24 [Candidatus Dojkabacteria bacterium]|nr:50S ribosomal protein L24 [Candidatus Dojkabacteria bacterium]